MTKTSEKTMAETAKERATEVAQDVSDAAADKTRREAEKARDMAAEETQKAADAAEAAAGEFDPGSMQAQAIEQVATRIDDLASQLRHTDVDRIARMVGDAARANPLMFVAGAALAGFAATRFLKARDPARARGHRADDPWNTGPDPYAAAPGARFDDRDLTSRGAV